MACRQLVRSLITSRASSLAPRPLLCPRPPRPSSLVQSFSTEPLRRRRRRANSSPDNDSSSPAALDPSSPATDASSSADEPFSPLSPDGRPLTPDEYLSLATLSPWVPCPEVVLKRALEIASASSSDRHVDLGCGDGRLNFASVSSPHCVARSVGVDVDENVLRRARDRLRRRFVPPWNNALDAEGDAERMESELDRVEFVRGDLMEVVEREKRRYQSSLGDESSLRDESSLGDESHDKIETSNADDERHSDGIRRLHDKIASSTLITMYFVDSALSRLKPYLSSVFGGKDDVRVVTVGYEIRGWEPDWAERVLDLTVFRYDMKMRSNDPVEWSLDYDAADAAANFESNTNNNNNNNNIMDEEAHQLAYILAKQKQREDEYELLNSKLRIHHDPELDAFASFRAKRMTMDSGGSMPLETPEQWEEDWDFDETEDYESVKRQEEIRKEKEKGMGRKGLMAGLDADDGIDTETKKKPVWKKPE